MSEAPSFAKLEGVDFFLRTMQSWTPMNRRNPRRRLLAVFPGFLLPSCLMIMSLWGCGNDHSGGSEGMDRVLSPRGKGEIRTWGQQEPQDGPVNAAAGTASVLRMRLPEEYLVQGMQDLDLDLDPEIEQAVILKTSGTNTLQIALLDHDTARDAWFLAQTLDTLSINIRTFTLRLLDLTGDGVPELLAGGTDAQGRQTLDAFCLMTDVPTGGDAGAPRPGELRYRPVLDIAGDLSIELRKVSGEMAGDEFAAGAAPPSYEISVQNRTGTDSSDLVEAIHTWDKTSKSFRLSRSRTIPGQLIEKNQLQDLMKAGTEDFERFVAGESGAWHRTLMDRSGTAFHQLLFFEPSTRSFRMIEGDLMESFRWTSSSHNPPGRLQIFLRNDSFQRLNTMATLVPLSNTSMQFYLQDRDEWSGVFVRLTPDEEKQMGLRVRGDGATLNPLVLAGLYRTETGGEIMFANPNFTWKQGERTRHGGFVTYQLNEMVLELQFVSDRGMIAEKEYYIIRTGTVRPDGAITLELEPARIGADGVKSHSRDIIRLVQSVRDGD